MRHFACTAILHNVQLFLLPTTNVVLACCHCFLFNIDSKGNICGEEENACLDLIVLVIADVVADPRPTHKVTIGLNLRVKHLKRIIRYELICIERNILTGFIPQLYRESLFEKLTIENLYFTSVLMFWI